MIMTTKVRDEEWDELKRDERGRFTKGTSGNRFGRPRKKRELPKSLAAEFADELGKEVAVNDNGKSQTVTMRQLIIKRLLRLAVTAKTNELLRIVEHLTKLGVFDLMDSAADEEPIFDDEDRAVLERIRRELEPFTCPTCNKLNMAGESPEDGTADEEP